MVLFDPPRTCRFAEALGKLAKTNTIDTVALAGHSTAFLNPLSEWPETGSASGVPTPEEVRCAARHGVGSTERCRRGIRGAQARQGGAMSGTEITFEVSEDELDGGYSASALGFGIHTQGETLDELRRNIREALDCYFDDSMERPRLIRLHYVRDEALVA